MFQISRLPFGRTYKLAPTWLGVATGKISPIFGRRSGSSMVPITLSVTSSGTDMMPRRATMPSNGFHGREGLRQEAPKGPHRRGNGGGRHRGSTRACSGRSGTGHFSGMGGVLRAEPVWVETFTGLRMRQFEGLVRV
ncbi:hypothetical protein ACFC0A_38345, partial [Kitasatospora purpeofusca]